VAQVWTSEIVPSLRPTIIRAIYSVPRLVGVSNGTLTIAAPNDAHRAKCEEFRRQVEAAVVAVAGEPVALRIVTDTAPVADDHDVPGSGGTVVPLHPVAPPPPDDEIDVHDLVDAPPESVVTPIERLAQAFPGSELMDERS
jgi:DNA polymerase-3 subunit gamma/tau